MARGRLVVAAVVVSALVAAVAEGRSAVRTCVRRTCRAEAKECADAFRARKAERLAACGTKRKTDPCRKAVRQFVRDGVRECGSAARACVTCCRSQGDPCTVAACGNGRIEPGEDCDTDAPGACAHGCRADCTCEPEVIVPVCGNGTIEPGEECEAGNAPACPARCRDDCTCAPAAWPCGNGALDDGEECDGVEDGACPERCRADCTCGPPPPPVCGNGVMEDGEACDATDDAYCPGSCLPDCRCPVCGDGVVEGSEACEPADDAACPGHCTFSCRCAVCGDGVVEGDEACEPTNDDNCPGRCLSDCRCPVCGDGVVEGGEQCEPSQGGMCTDVCSEISCDCVSSTTDDCAEPRRLEPLPAVDTQDTVTATTSPDDPFVECAFVMGQHSHSVWYVVTAPATGRIRADTAGSSYDTILLAHAGMCGELATIACNDDSDTDRARVEFPVSGGVDYLLEAASYAGDDPGQLRLSVSFLPCGDGILQDGEACEPALAGSCALGPCTADCACLPPIADECADAVPAALPVDVEVDADTATGTVLDPKLSCVVQPVNPARSAWFRFVAPVDGTVRVDTNGSSYDTSLGVFEGACGELTQITCNDDDIFATDDLTSRVDVGVSAGVTYTILVTPYLNNAPGRLHVHAAYEDLP